MISADVIVKAQFYDLDPMQVVWHGNYARFLEQARAALLDKIGFGYREMAETGYLWPVVDLRIKYVRPILYGQEVRVTATMAEYEYRLKIDYRLADVMTGEVLTKAHTIQVAVDAATRELCFQSPAVLYEKVERHG
jgi:acyl-CoA thioester hydrolase